MTNPSKPQSIIDWCKREADSLKRQLELFESGQSRSSMKMEFGPWQDTTDQTIAWLRSNLAELTRILCDNGPKTAADS